MIYFIRDTSAGLVKIGFSADPWRRFVKMQADCPFALEIIRVVAGDRAGEAALHAAFAGDRVRGEWFRWTAALAERVVSLEAICRPEAAQRTGETAAFIRRLSAASGQSANTVKGWIFRGSIPGRFWLAISRAGVMTLEELAIQAAGATHRPRRKAA